MPTAKIKEFLDRHAVRYTSIVHARARTAAEVAASAHVAGRDFAKTLVLMVDGEMVLVVVPATRRLVLSDLREMLGTSHVRLATEAEFRDRFPDCELGAMPPFGNLYGLRVYVSSQLATEPEIVFNAGTHTEAVKLSYADFADLVRPTVVDLATA